MTFTDGTKEITFKTPYKDLERSELSREGHDLLSSRVILSEDDYDRECRKPSDLEDGFYKDTIKLGPEYMTEMNDEGEVMLYLMRRSLEVLRKFHFRATRRGFLSQKGSGGGRGVKEKNKDVAAKDGVSPSVTNETVVKEKEKFFG
ncbi:hypothetical protein Tco_0491357 [Tanacetum coccineum]